MYFFYYSYIINSFIFLNLVFVLIYFLYIVISFSFYFLFLYWWWFLFIFCFFFCVFVVYGLPQAFGLRNDKKNCHCKVLKKPWQSQYGVQFYLFMGFFLFSVFVFTFCGLWGFASLCKGGSCEATGGLREKLKIENWKLIFHLKLILWLDK